MGAEAAKKKPDQPAATRRRMAASGAEVEEDAGAEKERGTLNEISRSQH